MGMLMLDLGGNIRWVNQAFCELLGYSEAEILDKSFADLTHVEDVKLGIDRYEQFLAGDASSAELEKRYVHKDGSLIWVQLHSSVVAGDQPDQTQFICHVQDISERKRMEEELQRSHHDLESRVAERTQSLSHEVSERMKAELSLREREIKLRQNEDWTAFALARAKIGAWEWNVRDDKHIWDNQVRENFGIKASDAEGSREEEFFEAIHPDDLDKVMAANQQALGEAEDYNVDFRVIWPDGSVHWLNSRANIIVGDDGKPTRMVGACADISQRKRLEAHAASVQANFLDAIDGLQVSFSLWGPDGALIHANGRYRELAVSASIDLIPGVTYGEFLGRIYDVNVMDQSQMSREQWIQSRLADAGSDSSQYENLQPDGRWIDTRKQKLPDGSVMTINFDITDAKLREQVLDEARIAAETANRTKSEFLANMSHELRTPLNAVIGYSDALKNQIFGPLANPQQADYVDSILTSGNLLLSLIQDVLDVSAIEAGKLDLQSEEFSLESCFPSITNMVSLRAAQRQVSIIDTIDASLPDIFADQRRVKQIFANLLSNAVNFTEADGEVTLAAEATEDGELAVTVADNGIGMRQSDLETALDTFGRIRNSGAKTEEEGSGLGLPLVKGLIELHGGRLEMESRVGVGTTARVVFPKDRVCGGRNPAV
jgi:PAS domain S-box-containing protein